MASSSRNNGELSKKWADMCLDEEEDTEAIFDEEDGDETEPDLDDRWCLIGRLLTGKVSDFLVFQNIMADLWKPGKGMYVKILEQNRFLFQFYHEIDIRRVINGSPWTYDRKQLIIERLKPGGNPKNVMLNTLDLWVQIHDLQSGFRTEKAILEAGHSENFSLSSTIHHDEIVKPDGLWMKAPNRQAKFFDKISPWSRSGRCKILKAERVEAIMGSGLAFFWKNADEARLLGYSRNHIDFEITISHDTLASTASMVNQTDHYAHDVDSPQTLFLESHLPWCLIETSTTLLTKRKRGGPCLSFSLITVSNRPLHDRSLHDWSFAISFHMGTRSYTGNNLVDKA
uniref:DUF4283 domain-containing protein n=1 Tax=Cannabis sativa TaxID=3483 RepID=A0A803NUR8_CANSA